MENEKNIVAITATPNGPFIVEGNFKLIDREGKADKEDNVLINAPHPEYEVVANNWEHSYTREKAAYPIESVRENKFWINVARVDNTLGDRKLLPTCYGCFE